MSAERPDEKAKRDDAVIAAAHHHSDLNIFAAVIAMLEGGTVYTRQGLAGRDHVIKLCKEQTQKQLKLCDAALRRAGVK